MFLGLSMVFMIFSLDLAGCSFVLQVFFAFVYLCMDFRRELLSCSFIVYWFLQDALGFSQGVLGFSMDFLGHPMFSRFFLMFSGLSRFFFDASKMFYDFLMIFDDLPLLFCGCPKILRLRSVIRKAQFSPRVWKFLKFNGKERVKKTRKNLRDRESKFLIPYFL